MTTVVLVMSYGGTRLLFAMDVTDYYQNRSQKSAKMTHLLEIR